MIISIVLKIKQALSQYKVQCFTLPHTQNRWLTFKITTCWSQALKSGRLQWMPHSCGPHTRLTTSTVKRNISNSSYKKAEDQGLVHGTPKAVCLSATNFGAAMWILYFSFPKSSLPITKNWDFHAPQRDFRGLGSFGMKTGTTLNKEGQLSL